MRFDYNHIFLIPFEFYKSKYKIALIKECFIFGNLNKNPNLKMSIKYQDYFPVLYKYDCFLGEFFIIKSDNVPILDCLKGDGIFYHFDKKNCLFIDSKNEI